MKMPLAQVLVLWLIVMETGKDIHVSAIGNNHNYQNIINYYIIAYINSFLVDTRDLDLVVQMNQLWQMQTMYQIWLISFDFKRYIKWLTMILDVWKWTLFFILVLCNLQTENYCKVGIYCWYCNALQNDWNKFIRFHTRWMSSW